METVHQQFQHHCYFDLKDCWVTLLFITKLEVILPSFNYLIDLELQMDLLLAIIIRINIIKGYLYFLFFKYYKLITMAMDSYNLSFIFDLFLFKVEKSKAN